MPQATRAQIMSKLTSIVGGMTFTPAVMGTYSTWNTGPSNGSSSPARLKLWGDVPAQQRPYVALATHAELDEYQHLGLVRRRLEIRAYCYTWNDLGGPTGSQSDLDTIMSSFETALHPDDPSRNNFTLGGLVYWCRIQGRVLKVPGDLDGDALMLVPIVIEYP